ncbi:hypothetical protein BRADO6941 [Bradyrhizobium sp. ORS 278]|nr:hypothetical protein BRADO6941 [Bradyrhizobium sp. ORS 278]
MGNPLYVYELSPAERLTEVADILAAGLTRLQARKSSSLSHNSGESSFDYPEHQSSHADRLTSHGGSH